MRTAICLQFHPQLFLKHIEACCTSSFLCLFLQVILTHALVIGNGTEEVSIDLSDIELTTRELLTSAPAADAHFSISVALLSTNPSVLK